MVVHCEAIARRLLTTDDGPGGSRSGTNDHHGIVNEDASICGIGNEQIGFYGHLGVEIWDLSDRSNTRFIAAIEPPPNGGGRTSHNLDIVDNYMYTSWHEGGVRVHDIGDPSNPEEVYSWRGDGASFWTAKVAVPGGTFSGSDYGNSDLYTFADPADEGGDGQPPTASIDGPDAQYATCG